MGIGTVREKAGNVFYGWWMIVAGIVLCMFGYGAWYYSFGALFKPLSEEFGWSRATTSIAFSFSRLEGGIEGLFTGPLTDRFGPRALVRVGWTLTAIGFVWMAYIRNFPMFLVTYSLFLSLGMNAGLYMPLQTMVAKWFDRRRGIAMGSLTSGAAVGGFVLVPLTAWLIVTYGWRSAVVVLGITALVLGWGLSFALKPHPPEHYGLRPDGAAADEVIEPSASSAYTTAHMAHGDTGAGVMKGLSLRQAMKTQTFWIMVVAFTFTHTALSAIVVHEIPFLEDMGISKVVAAAALGTMTLMSTPGRFSGGFLADRWNLKYLYAVSSIVQAGALYLFSMATSMTWVWGFVVMYGLSYGLRIPLEPLMRAKYFGPKSFATIYGYMNAFSIVGSFGGPFLSGWIYDTTGSYVTAFIGCAVLMFIGAILVLFIRPPDESTFT